MQLDPKNVARIIRNFIANPLDSAAFAEFFALCFHYTRGYLVRLPYGQRESLRDVFSSDPQFEAAAISIPGKIFENPDKKHPFPRICDYFGPLAAGGISDEELMNRFVGFIGRQLRQEISRLIYPPDPQRGNIRKALRRTLKSEEYEQIPVGKRGCWAWRCRKDALREQQPEISRGQLDHFVLSATHARSRMPDRCRLVFSTLDQDDRYRNFLGWDRLLGTFLTVLGDTDDDVSPRSYDPRLEYLRRTLHDCGIAITGEIAANELRHFAERRNMSLETVEAYRRALRSFVEDFVDAGDTAPLPQYLKEELPGNGDDYLKNHKHVWETLTGTAVDRVRQWLRDRGLEPPQIGGDR